MDTHQDIRDLLGPHLSLDELWLLREEGAESGETDLETEEAFQEIAAAIASGKFLCGSTRWEFEDGYEL